MKKKNQTSYHFIAQITEYPNVKGLLLYVDFDETNTLTKMFKKDLTYHEAIAFGNNKEAFKFIPYGEKLFFKNRLVKIVTKSTFKFTERWKCQGKCTEQQNCTDISEVCLCVNGECY